MPRLKWFKFSSLDDDSTLSLFLTEVKRSTVGALESQSSLRNLQKHATRTSIKYEPIVEHGNFWDYKFKRKQQVTWNQFQKGFEEEFRTEISSSYKSEESVQLLCNVIKNDVLETTDMVTKDKFLEVVGGSEHRKHFWKVVNDKATEKYCIKEVFNIHSSVRLSAVENLGELCFCDTLI